MPVLSIDPTTSTQIEYVPFSLTYTVIFDPLDIFPKITGVTITASDGNDYSDLVTTSITSDTTCTITGELSDVFNRSMVYYNALGEIETAHRWAEIPPDFQTIYKYSGATVGSITLTVTIITTEGNISSDIVVNNDYATANARLSQYVALGKY